MNLGRAYCMGVGGVLLRIKFVDHVWLHGVMEVDMVVLLFSIMIKFFVLVRVMMSISLDQPLINKSSLCSS